MINKTFLPSFVIWKVFKLELKPKERNCIVLNFPLFKQTDLHIYYFLLLKEIYYCTSNVI